MDNYFPLPSFTTGADFAFSVELSGSEDSDFDDIVVEYALSTEGGSPIVSLSSADDDDRLVFADLSDEEDPDRWAITVRFPVGFLSPGTYHHQARFRRVSTDETTLLFEGYPIVTQGAF